MTQQSEPTLKCVIARSDTRNLCDLIEQVLRERAGAEEVRRLNEDAYIVCTSVATDAVRDWITPRLREGESILVLEFEKWSGYGFAIDAEWLMRRGH